MTNTLEEKISDRLSEVAEELFEGNQANMSREMGMSPQGMNPYFKGDRAPGFKILKRLVELGVNVTWVLSGSGPMLIKDMKDGLSVVMEDGSDFEEGQNSNSSDPNFFSHINVADLSDTERSLLAEAKQFSDYLKTLDVPLQVKRLMLELMIEHIGQEIQRLRSGPS